MRFNDHPGLSGKHALLSPSQYHWINYSDQKLEAKYHAASSSKRGTDLHEFAHKAIELGIRMPDTDATLSLYVNDGIDYKMHVEVPLYYSVNCFGHADTLAYRKKPRKKGLLRIHDLKTGIHPASPHQLEVYAAIFCLEYGVSPFDIDMDLRIYQNDHIETYSPYPETIQHIMDRIVDFDQKIEAMKEGDAW